MFLDSAQSFHRKIFEKREADAYAPLSTDIDLEDWEISDFGVNITIDTMEEAEELHRLIWIVGCIDCEEKRFNSNDFVPEDYIEYVDSNGHHKSMKFELKIQYAKWMAYLKETHDNSCKGDYSFEKAKKVLLNKIFDYYQETENDNLSISESVLGEYVSLQNDVSKHDNENLEYRLRFCETMDLLSQQEFFDINKLEIDISATPIITEIEGFNKYSNEEIFKKLPAQHFTYKITLLPKFFKYLTLNNIKEELYYLDINNGYLLGEKIGAKQLDIQKSEFKALKMFTQNNKNIVDMALLLNKNRKTEAIDLTYESNEIAKKLRKLLSIDKSKLRNKNGYLTLSAVRILKLQKTKN